MQEAARRYTDTSWQIFNQNRKNKHLQITKNSNGNTYQKLESTDEIQSPSPISSFSNGSVTISRETSPKSKETSPTSDDVKRTESQIETASSENESAASILYEKIVKPDPKQIVKIETVEVTYEPVKVLFQSKSVSVLTVHH